MATEDGAVWDLIDRIDRTYREASEGDVAIELWRVGPNYGYTLIPLKGDWRALLNDPEQFEAWERMLLRNHIIFDVFRINEYSCGEWEAKALWSRENGVRWLE